MIAFGSIEALIGSLGNLRNGGQPGAARHIWVRFAGWILLSLEFTLGADIIRSAIAPTWDEIGKLAAVASIRTALNFFLGLDIQEAERLRAERLVDRVTAKTCPE